MKKLPKKKDGDAVWEGLGISNDFLFGKVMRDPELCRELLRRILPELMIDHIEYPELQKAIRPDRDARSIRLDVYVSDEKGRVYDLEMQVGNTYELPKRARYYQGMIDLELIDRGESYKVLNRSYVIFICLFDVFGKGRYRYTFENICKEDPSVSLGDETVKVFLNAQGKQGSAAGDLKSFLDYVLGKKSEDPFIRKLDRAVRKAKKNRKWRREYMTLWMRDQENIEKGIEQGIEQGTKMIIRNMHRKNCSIEQIAFLTEKPVEEVENIIRGAEQDKRKNYAELS